MSPENPAVTEAKAAVKVTVKKAPPGVLVIFGASGDLTSRKLMPALASLAHHKLLPDQFSVVGVARTDMHDDTFRDHMRKAVPDGGPEWDELVGRFRYIPGEYAHPDTFETLKRVLDEVDAEYHTGGNRTYYMAIPPTMFQSVINAIGQHRMNRG